MRQRQASKEKHHATTHFPRPKDDRQSIRLRQTAKEAGITNKNILIGTNYMDKDLEQKVLRLALRGIKVICIDECREEQVAFLRRIKDRICNSVTVHIVVAN